MSGGGALLCSVYYNTTEEPRILIQVFFITSLRFITGHLVISPLSFLVVSYFLRLSIEQTEMLHVICT